VRSIARAQQPRDTKRPALLPTSVTLISRGRDTVRSLEAHLCDAGVSSKWLCHAKLDQLLVLDTPAVVMFLDGFALSSVLATAKAMHSQRPELPLVFVAGQAERFALWRAFEGSALPPLVLRESAPAAVVHDAVRIACDAWVAEHLGRPLDSAQSATSIEGPLFDVAQMLTLQEQLRDHLFDRLLPMRLRAASDQFWTPLDVVRRAAEWFEQLGMRSVVDIGSGVGKFCIAGALMSTCSFVGIEYRPRLATVARNLARAFELEGRVCIIDGRFGDIETPVADCYYLFNPFEENLFPADEALDNDVELSPARFRKDLRCFRTLASSMPIGAYVLSYNGIGGPPPDFLDEVRVDRNLPAVLRLFQKVRRERTLSALPP
jgi:SAM-dependent methyltransferase